LRGRIGKLNIDGKEYYIGVLGNKRLQIFDPWELDLSNLPKDAPKIATQKVKWSSNYRDKHKIKY